MKADSEYKRVIVSIGMPYVSSVAFWKIKNIKKKVKFISHNERKWLSEKLKI
jgi:hypothetical protein